jgi:flagellar hook-basal body complex protein FliE
MNPLSLVGRLMPRDVQMVPLPKETDDVQAIPLADLQKLVSGQGVKPTEGASFDNVLGNLVREVNGKQLEAAAASRDMMAGGKVSLHQAMIAMEEASVSFQLMVEVRNKLLESYQEIMRMQL